jgi:hypothetical protein
VTSPLMPAASNVEAVIDAMRTQLRHGAWSFRVVTGDVEQPAEAAALKQLRMLAEQTGCLLLTEGRNDETTWVFAEDGGRAAVMAMQGLAVTVGRFWWRTETRFGGAVR